MKRFLPLFLILIFAPLALAADFPARVVGVSDGDTLTVLTPEKRQVKIRLHGIDAPESGQDFGARAKQAASEMAFGKEVTVNEVDRDRYGRTVAEVILPDGRSLGREMVRAGYAWHYVKYAPADRELATLEAEARAAKRGLWSQRLSGNISVAWIGVTSHRPSLIRSRSAGILARPHQIIDH